MWDLIVSVPDHCLSFYLVTNISYISLHPFLFLKTSIKVNGKTGTFNLHCATLRFYIVRNRLIVVITLLKSKKLVLRSNI